MSPTETHAALAVFGDLKRTRHLATDEVLNRLDEPFLERVATAHHAPGYLDYELSLSRFDGWPTAAEPLALTSRKVEGEKDRWQIVSGQHVLAAAKKLCKPTVPCFFIATNEIGRWVEAIASRSLKAPGLDEDDEEALVRAFYRDDS